MGLFAKVKLDRTLLRKGGGWMAGETMICGGRRECVPRMAVKIEVAWGR